jgi:hypothetical protein
MAPTTSTQTFAGVVNRPQTALTSVLESLASTYLRMAGLRRRVWTLYGSAPPSAAIHDRRLSGELKIMAAILEQPVIEKSLNHLGLKERAPPRASARGQALQAVGVSTANSAATNRK